MLARYLIPAAAALTLAGCGGTEPQHKSATAPVAVHTITLQAVAWPNIYEATGTVRARTAAVLSSTVMGYIRQVNARAGDRVRRGEILIVLDSRELEAGLRQAEAGRDEARSGLPESDGAIASAKANLELSEITFRRMQELFEKKSISNQEFDEVSAKLKVAKGGYEMALAKKRQLESRILQADQSYRSAEVMRSYAEIASPFDGVVTERTAEPGGLASPGQPLLTVEQAGVYRLEASVEESKLAAVGSCERIPVRIDALGRDVEGRVAEIVPAVDAAAHAFLARIDLPAIPGLRSGMFGRAKFAAGSRKAIAIPKDAIEERGQLRVAFVVDSGRVQARLITTGEAHGTQLEVLSGLNAGERIVVPIPSGLSDGCFVGAR